MIEYLYQEGVKACSKEPLKVRLNGRICGEIRKVSGGFQYFPERQEAGGEVFPTVTAVQQSLKNMTIKIMQPPTLDHDAAMLKKYGTEVSPNGKLERRIVFNLCEFLKSHSFDIVRVNDGGEWMECSTTKTAMELIFVLSCDATLNFRKIGFGEHRVLLALGNGADIIADWSYGENDLDGFDSAMQAFNPEDYT